jgi:transcriptional regulator with XRE-family HTH domain
MNSIGNARAKLGLTQEQVAHAVGCKRSLVAHWETCPPRRNVQRDYILPLAELLRLPVEEIINPKIIRRNGRK